MPENPQEPREYDVVLGGENPPPVNGAVLGGIKGVKHRLSSKVVEARVAALKEALNYGDAGLDLVIEGLEDGSMQVKSAAIKLLSKRKEYKVQLALLLRLKPTNPKGYNKRGLAREKLGDLQGATDFSRIITLNPPSPEIYYYNRGVCHLSRKDYINAIKDFSQTVKINSSYFNAYYNRGCCYFELKDYPATINDFSSAIQFNPQYAQAYSGRGSAYIKLGEVTKAEFDFQKVKELEG